MQQMRYRSDIDGLRSLAVVPILLFHAGISALSGGFAGVDVFFVISGFLITKIIVSEIENDSFSLGSFYRRRIVRIFPALFAMLLVVLLFAYVTMLPIEFHELSLSVAAAAGFLSNVLFWQQSGYFAQAAESKPLLHTWSLGVEEQFYILYPALLLLVQRFMPGRIRTVLLLVAALSFAISAMLALFWPDAGFYLLPSRAWELALGAIIAMGMFPRLRAAGLRMLASVAGLALIIGGYVVIRSGMHFPAPWALAPCLGAALLLAYGEDTPTGALLGSAPFRIIGKISYSLYLWHWPIITFYRLHYGNDLEFSETVLLVTASFVFATISYKLIEQPFLKQFGKTKPRPVLISGAVALVVVAACAAALAGYSQSWRHYPSDVLRIASYEDYTSSPAYSYQFRAGGPCFRGVADSNLAFRPDLCTRIAEDRPNMVVVGDSHAAHLWRAFALRYRERNVMQATASGCRPTVRGIGAKRCREVVDYVFGPLLSSGKLNTVILSGRWQENDLPLVAATVAHIRAAGAQAVVIGPTNEFQGDLPIILAHETLSHDLSAVAGFRKTALRQIDLEMAKLVRDAGGTYISVLELECPTNICRLTAPNGTPMQFDYGHLTLPGSVWVVNQMPEL